MKAGHTFYLSTFTFYTVAAQNTLTKLKAACFSKFAIFKTSVNSRSLNIPARRSNQSILKEINPEYSLKGLILKLQYFGHLKRQLSGRDPDAGKDWGQEANGMTEDDIDRIHRRNEHKLDQPPGDSKEPGSLACCSPWGHKDLDVT